MEKGKLVHISNILNRLNIIIILGIGLIIIAGYLGKVGENPGWALLYIVVILIIISVLLAIISLIIFIIGFFKNKK